MTALLPSPANSQVSRARCIGLQRTRANACLASTGCIRSASRRPLSVNGISVVPVCCPLRLHAVSPCLSAKALTFPILPLHVVLHRLHDAHAPLLLLHVCDSLHEHR